MARPSRRDRPPLSRWLRRGLLGLIALLLLGGGAVALGLWLSQPAQQGTLRLPGLGAPVAVTLDGQGIPRIAAASETDAAMALGWLHARDRLFQMEMMRRGGAGRLAEVAGKAALPTDRLMRTFGLARLAEADLALLPAETRAVLDAYAAGVNAWIAARGRFAAPEFVLLGAPAPWRPADSLLWGKIMGVWLSGNWRTELARGRLAATLPAERVRDLSPGDASAGRPDRLALDPAHLGRLTAILPRFPDPFTLPASASNAWAVAPAHSASGGALLAADPHLGFSAPILWYLARIDLADGRLLAGATSPGVPFMVIGRSRDLAWGFTTTHSDTQDLFAERLLDEHRYETPEGPQPFTLTEEIIEVRGEASERLYVRATRHGPVISDLDRSAPPGMALALAAANLAPADTSAAGLHALNRARSIAEARTAAAQITGQAQNLIVADREGGIAFYLTGRTPLRRAGDGQMPVAGWSGAYDWSGWVPFEAMPHVSAPESGVLVNANNRPAPPDNQVFLGHDWPGDWRARRIGALLASGGPHTAADFARLQGDTVSLFARDLLLPPDAVLRRLPRPPGAAGQAHDLLLAWDGDARAALPQPLIFNAWIREFGRLALAKGGVPAGAWTAEGEFLARLLAPGSPLAGPWCGGDCAPLVTQALTQAVAGLTATEGPDPAAWRWAGPHIARFEHPLLRGLPVLGPRTRLEAPTGGDEWTISRGGIPRDGFRHVHGAGLRLVADLADPDRTLAIIATGQSGNPLSAYWGNLLPAWRDGRPLLLTRQPARVSGEFRLLP
jgi:penicillin amidase